MSEQAAPPARETRRLWEVDALRGVAVVAMIFYHLVFDLYFLGAMRVAIYSWQWQLVARSIGSTFIFLMGVSLTLRLHRLPPGTTLRQVFTPFLRRGLELLGWGMVVTGVTYFVVGPRFVVFGILHLLGASTILAFPLLRWRWASLAAGVAAIALGVRVGDMVLTGPWLLWLGGQQVGRGMVDHYPLLPWGGIALIGVFVGHTLYPQGKRRLAMPAPPGGRLARGLLFLGRHSLTIYLVHQPLLIGLLLLLGIGSLW